MGIEVRPVSIHCNLSCRYCYQHAQRGTKNFTTYYDAESVKKAVERYNKSFTLFGGEPLLMAFCDLEDLLKWGFDNYKKNSIQTNGTLITPRHIGLFKKYNVDVGISIDGPDELNHVRWAGSTESTIKITERIQQTIDRLCEEEIFPGLIITLHRGNATAEKLPFMHKWFKYLDQKGITSVRLHLLEVESEEINDLLSLTIEENIDALQSFTMLERELKNIRFDITSEIRNLLLGRDGNVSCVWRACDPLSTLSVLGIEGDGSQSKCGRVNKEGIEYLRPETAGYERYVALYNTPQDEGGCHGCRFFLFCKGQCPGTALNGDWRNKTEHCEVWRHLFRSIEKQLILEGHSPLSIHPVRKVLELNLVRHWKDGANPPISQLSWVERETDTSLHPFKRCAWLSENEKAAWLAHNQADELFGFAEISVIQGNMDSVVSDSTNKGIRIVQLKEAKIITNGN
jgi:uncharacterized protein